MPAPVKDPSPGATPMPEPQYEPTYDLQLPPPVNHTRNEYQGSERDYGECPPFPLTDSLPNFDRIPRTPPPPAD